MKDSKKYFKDIKKLIPLKDKRTRDFLGNLNSQIKEFELENDNCTYTDLSYQLGTPEEVVAAYFGETKSNEFIRTLTIKKYFKYITIFIIVIASLLTLWKGYLIYKDYEESNNQRARYIETTEPEEISNEKID